MLGGFEEVEGRLALALHYCQHETWHGERYEGSTTVAQQLAHHLHTNLGGRQVRDENCLAAGDLGCNGSGSETAIRGGR